VQDAVLQYAFSHLYLCVFKVHTSILVKIRSQHLYGESTMHDQVLDENNSNIF